MVFDATLVPQANTGQAQHPESEPGSKLSPGPRHWRDGEGDVLIYLSCEQDAGQNTAQKEKKKKKQGLKEILILGAFGTKMNVWLST